MNSQDRPRELLPFDGSALLHGSAFTALEASELYETLLATIPWEQHHITMFGRRVAEPRLSAWFGDPGTTYVYSGEQRRPSPWTEPLISARARCEWLADARFNSVLVNLYRGGSDSMGWHSDDEPELGPEPIIASVSLGHVRRLRFRHRSSRETVGVDLPHGSVLAMSGLCQQAWSHSVPKTPTARDPRINLTFRWTEEHG